jgi:signal transduction histidine kinase
MLQQGVDPPGWPAPGRAAPFANGHDEPDRFAQQPLSGIDAAAKPEASPTSRGNLKPTKADYRLLAAASHDLRQPLYGLSLYVDTLRPHVAPAGQPLLANMQDCIDSMTELLGNLLSLSRLEAGAIAPCPIEFPIADVLEQLASVHAPECFFKGLRLRRAPTDWMARTDPVLFKRIVGNLMANAVRYTQRGGVLIACRRRQGKAWVEVWDTGIGIPPGKTDEIFNEFKQLADGAQQPGPGSEAGPGLGFGLGLAIVEKSAALLGLDVRVRSRLGRGTVFAIEVPLAQPGMS